MNNVSKVKIAVGYTLLLAVLFFFLVFRTPGMENLILTDDRDVQWTDSVLALIREKDTNTIKMLRTLSEANDSMVSTSDIEQIIAQQDSVVDSAACAAPYHYTSGYRRDTPSEEGVFSVVWVKCLSPPKKDTAIQVKPPLNLQRIR